MTPPMLRQLWTIIEVTQPSTLLTLDDQSLVNWLVHEVDQERSLDDQEADLFSRYIYSRLSLIRDLAQGR